MLSSVQKGSKVDVTNKREYLYLLYIILSFFFLFFLFVFESRYLREHIIVGIGMYNAYTYVCVSLQGRVSREEEVQMHQDGIIMPVYL